MLFPFIGRTLCALCSIVRIVILLFITSKVRCIIVQSSVREQIALGRTCACTCTCVHYCVYAVNVLWIDAYVYVQTSPSSQGQAVPQQCKRQWLCLFACFTWACLSSHWGGSTLVWDWYRKYTITKQSTKYMLSLTQPGHQTCRRGSGDLQYIELFCWNAVLWDIKLQFISWGRAWGQGYLYFHLSTCHCSSQPVMIWHRYCTQQLQECLIASLNASANYKTS